MFWQSIDINSIQLKVSYDPETGEGTIDFPAAESSKAGAEAGSEEEAGSKVKSINFQTA